MPAKSKKQRKAMAIAEHHPEELYARNKGMLGMSKSDLSEFASVKEKGLPEKIKRTSEAKKKAKRRLNSQSGKSKKRSV